MEGCNEILAPVLHPCHRAPELARQPGHNHELRRQRHFLPEATADIGRDHPQIGLWHCNEIGNDRPQCVRHLRRAGERDALAHVVPCGMRCARLDRQRVLSMRADREPDALMRPRHRRVEARGLQAPFDRDVAGGFGMDERGAARERRIRADDCWAWFDFDLDAIGDVLGLFAAGRDHGGDRLADEPYDLARQHRLADRDVIELVQHRPDRLDGCQIGGGEHQRALGCVDPNDPARRHRASHEADPSRGREIACEAAATGDQRRILEASDRAADPAATAVALGIAGHSVARFAIAQRRRANTRRGFASAIASISAADSPADRSSASGSMSAGGNE